MNKKNIIQKKYIWALIFWLLSIALMVISRKSSLMADFYMQKIYPVFVNVFGRIFNVLPISFLEMLLYAVILFVIIYPIHEVVRGMKEKCMRKKLAELAGTLLLLSSVIAFSYVIGCGINYSATPWSVKEGYQADQYDDDDLKALCEYLTREVNAAADKVFIDPEGELVLAEKADVVEEAGNCMNLLGEEYQSLSGYYPSVKEVIISRILTLNQVTGIYSPFTFEANYNGEMPKYEIPVTMCHELSHLKGFMREDEANFLAVMACLKSKDPEFWFSGLMMAYSYSMNAYYKSAGRDAYFEIYDKLDKRAALTWTQGSKFWKKYEGKVSETHEKVNDAYLKANGQPAGHKTYDHVVTLLLSWYEKNGFK